MQDDTFTCKRGHKGPSPGRIGCRQCKRERSNAKWHELKTDPVKYQTELDRRTKKLRADPRLDLLYSARSRAKSLSLPCTISIDDIVVPDRCPILGTPIEKGRHRVFDGSPSLDRLIPELGYVPGNIAVISYRANALKGNASPEELLALANWVRAQYPEWLLQVA